jgi:hypothetical protein
MIRVRGRLLTLSVAVQHIAGCTHAYATCRQAMIRLALALTVTLLAFPAEAKCSCRCENSKLIQDLH